MLDEPVPRYMWVGTFHSLCARFLRENADRAGLRKTFPIYDESDQKSLVKRLLKERGLNQKEFAPREVLSFIEGCKGRGERADDVKLEPWQMQKQYYPCLLEIYRDYENALKRSGACDYTELLLRTFEVLRDDAETREMMQRHFSEILIDEFQDTSTLQFRLVRLLASLSRISPAALLVKVTAMISRFITFSTAMSQAILLTSTRVLPEPAPAYTRRLVRSAVTASFWRSLRDSTTFSRSICFYELQYLIKR